MTDHLPYTYTDDDGVALRVGARVCTAYDRPGRTSVGFYTPTGENAVALARAILAAGDTGHMVISQARLAELHDRLAYSDTHVANAARSMRERIADAMEVEYGLASRITELEALVADQANALEGHSRAIAELRTQMSSAQAAIRGLGQNITPTTVEDDL